MDTLISVTEAKDLLHRQDFRQKIAKMVLSEAAGYTLAEDVHALVDIPNFRQSSMDGYAFAFESWKPGQALSISGEVPAGRGDRFLLKPGTAARIFTGAPLPEGADTVVMQERTSVSGGNLLIDQPAIQAGEHVRTQGSEIKAGELAAQKGCTLHPATIGFLAGLGISEVTVYKAPSVAVMITGDELQQAGKALGHGQVYEASSVMLKAALAQMGIRDVQLYFAKDDLAGTVSVLEQALSQQEVVLVTGGVSVGDYDFVVQAANQCGVEKIFHRIRQKPGKPLYFGRRGDQPVFGLPGNPSSVLTCFYQYVWPVLRRRMGLRPFLFSLQASLSTAYAKQNQLTHFLKGAYSDGSVSILGAQDSYRLRSFAVADCLVILGEEMRTYAAGEKVTVQILPTYG